MEKKIKTQRRDDAKESISPKKPLSPFNFPDLTIKIGDEKLYVNRDDLMEASPYFLKMLTGNFKERDAREIPLPDEDPTTFALFLRHILPGFDGLKLTEEEAHLILPLAHKYLIDILLSKIDRTLAFAMTEKEFVKNTYQFNATDELINKILEAELYNQPNFLTACIKNAYKFSYMVLIKRPNFHLISGDTKAKILLMRCEELELGIDKCLKVIDESRHTKCYFSDCIDRKKVEKVRNILNSKELNRSRPLDL